MIFRALDIEAVVDESVWTKPEQTYRLEPHADLYGAGGVGVRAVPAEQFPPPHAWHVVAVAAVDVSFDASQDPKYRFSGLSSRCDWGAERRLLAGFASSMDVPAVHLVTWNGRGYDLPVLSMRSFKHGVPCRWYYADRDVRYRFSVEGHLDLMDFYADYGSAKVAKLGDVARLVGLPGKTDMTGESVLELDREIREHPEREDEISARVGRYCLQDAMQTALLFVRSRLHVGKVTPVTYNAVVRTFRDAPEVVAAIEVDWDRLMVEEST